MAQTRFPPMPSSPSKRSGKQPVFVRHPPILTDPRAAKPYWHVPYPYQFKMDKGWIFVLVLAAEGLYFKPLLVPAILIAIARVWIWLCFRFPITMSFFNGMLSEIGRGRRR